MLYGAIVSFILIYFTRKYLAYRRSVKFFSGLIGCRTLFSGRINVVMPRIPGILRGESHLFKDRFSVFQQVGWNVYVACSVWPEKPLVFIADAEVIKKIASSRHKYPKPVELYDTLSFFGRNIVASEGDEWKRYRRLTAPAFSDRNNRLVWDETVRIVSDLFNDVWKGKDAVAVDHCVEITRPLALAVIGSAGFGHSITWEDDVIPPNHLVSFKDALTTVAEEAIFKVVIPKWAAPLIQRGRRAELAYKEFGQYMIEMIRERQKSERIERHDLFTSLLNANDEVQQEAKLAEQELLGNIYIFLLAGHETTAHTLCLAFGLLALYPEEQDKLYNHIKSIIPDDRLPTYEEMPLFTYCMAVLYETLRLYPAITTFPKAAAEDSVLTFSNQRGEYRTIAIPKGTDLVIDITALHYNPKYWEDPYAFKPSRFLRNDWNRDAFIPFSAGARACLGRRFFETEGIAILTLIVLRYKISVKKESKFAGETLEQTQERILNTRQGLTRTPIRTPLVFTRRQ